MDLAGGVGGLDLSQVRYKELQVVSDTVEALSGTGETVHDTNLCRVSGYEWGAVADAFAKADHGFAEIDQTKAHRK